MRIFFLLTLISSAQFQDVWRLGVSDDKLDEFSMESHEPEEVTAQSAETLDDHYYFKGRYDKVGSVKEDESLKNFERALKLSDPNLFLHFFMEEVNLEKEYRVELDFVWGGHLAGGTDWEHVLEVKMNEEEIAVTPAHQTNAFYHIAVPTALLKEGANTLRISRRDDGQDAYTAVDTIALQASTKTFPDTDKDGVSDDWEKYAGTDWEREAETPKPLRSMIGINFISNEYPEEGAWLSGEVNGFIPQANWNQVGPLRQWHVEDHKEIVGGTHEISSPRFGQIVDASGTPLTEMSLRTVSSRCATSHNKLGRPASKLLNGFLGTDNDYAAKIEVKNIPYEEYDLYVYVSTDHTEPEIKVSVHGAEPQTCQALGSTPVRDFLYTPRTAHPKPPFSNVVKFSSLREKNLYIRGERVNEKTVGIAGIQIINPKADLDEDKVPDWYELQHGLHFSNKWDGNKDPDKDGLKNHQEVRHNTSPTLPDTDGDGLSDKVESNTGSYKSAQDTGTDPLWADTDDDGISDGEELTSFIISNPLKKDTDEDGVDDKKERTLGLSPNSKKLVPFGVPHMKKGEGFTWEFNDIQLIWDHGKLAPDDWRKRTLFHIDCKNKAAGDYWGSFQVFMHQTPENEVYFGCFSHALSGFSHEDGRNEVWMEKRDGDYKEKLGFSGKGAQDISDLLSLIMEILPNPETDKWDLTFTVKNLSTREEVVVIEKSGFTPSPSLEKDSVEWEDFDGLPFRTHSYNGLKLYQTARDFKKLDLPPIKRAETDLDALLAGHSSLEKASRFLNYASFGATPELILEVEDKGAAAWIEEQIVLPPSYLSPYVREIHKDYYGAQLSYDNYGRNENNNTLLPQNLMSGFARGAVLSEDQLRQRVAYALSQLLVISREDNTLNNAMRGMADYYDLFVKHAFGNYKDLLREVTYHPAMGAYLTSAGSSKAIPEKNIYPDENYARELMQLFTCGLWQLEPNGEKKKNADGDPLPTYTNDEITECARVFTGLWFSGNHWKGGGWQDNHFLTPMDIHVKHHDFQEKKVINGHVIPAREATEENARKDIEDLLTVVFEHPSTAPFISRFLIQQLVTDNPSPEYIERVSGVFSDNGRGERGDLKAVIKAILLDSEALSDKNINKGKLREPFLRYMHAARILKLTDYPDLIWWDYGSFNQKAAQEPLFAPSVFNFYSSDYDAEKSLRENDLVSPVFQITNDYTSVSFPNHLWDLLENGFKYDGHYDFPPDYRDLIKLKKDPEKMIQYVDLLCCSGRMLEKTREVLRENLEKMPPDDYTGRIMLTLFIGLTCPEGAVQN